MVIEVQETRDGFQQARDAFQERFSAMVIESLEVASIYIGTQLGYYAALFEHGPQTPTEFAARTGTHERYAREWLEQQTIAGILELEAGSPELTSAARRFRLPEAHGDLLVRLDEEHRMGETGGFVTALFSLALQTPAVIEAFRTGRGVPFESYGVACVHGVDGMSPKAEDDPLPTEWIPAMPDVHQRLQQDPPARVADIGCGGGKALIALARHYPKIEADGFDLDRTSVELARRNAERAGVADRVQFHCLDAAELGGRHGYDLVMSIACVHDMAYPVQALSAMRAMAGDGGTVFVADPLLDPFVGQIGERSDRFAYAASVLHCLPVSMVFDSSAGTGCAMKEATLRGYAAEAGYSDVQIVPIERQGFLGYYRLTP